MKLFAKHIEIIFDTHLTKRIKLKIRKLKIGLKGSCRGSAKLLESVCELRVYV